MKSKIYSLLGITVIWYHVYLAHKAGYDENYGYIIFAMIISMMLTLVVSTLWYLKKWGAEKRG